MEATRQRRVFVKLACGSSASGVVAFRTAGPRMQAITTVELERRDEARDTFEKALAIRRTLSAANFAASTEAALAELAAQA